MHGKYTPQLSEKNIRRLYALKQQSGRSMVRLLNEIVAAYFATQHPQTDTTTAQRKES